MVSSFLNSSGKDKIYNYYVQEISELFFEYRQETI